MKEIKETIRIYSLLNSTHKKTLCYIDSRGKYRWMDRQGNVYTGKPDAKQEKEVDVLQIDMGSYKKYEGNKGDSLWEEKVKFFKEHPSFEIEGEVNKFLIKPEYRIEIEKDQTQKKFDEMGERMAAAYKLKNLSFSDLRDTAFTLGIDPRELSHSALLVALMGGPSFNGPAMTKRVSITKNGEELEVLEVNLLRGKKQEEREMLATIHKAIILGIIKDNAGVYEVADKTMGGSIPVAMDWCKANPSFYNAYIVKNVQEKDTINPDLRDLDEEIKVSEYQAESAEKKKAKAEKEEEKQLETVETTSGTSEKGQKEGSPKLPPFQKPSPVKA